jgi:hypothetical protein
MALVHTALAEVGTFYTITSKSVFDYVGIIKVEKLRMELKCHYYDVTDVDVFNVFYHKKTMSDTETGFLSC